MRGPVAVESCRPIATTSSVSLEHESTISKMFRSRFLRNALVVFTGISGSGKSSLAFGTLYAEAKRRYLESVSPYARRLFHQMAVPEVDDIEGLPPAVALQQQRGSPTTRSSAGSVTTLSNLVRMLYSRAGD